MKVKKSRFKLNDDINPAPKAVKLDLPPRNQPDENEENMRKYLQRKKEQLRQEERHKVEQAEAHAKQLEALKK